MSYRYSTFNNSNSIITDSRPFKTKKRCEETVVLKEFYEMPETKFAVIYDDRDSIDEELAIKIADIKIASINSELSNDELQEVIDSMCYLENVARCEVITN